MTARDETLKGEFICVVCPNGCAMDVEFTRGAGTKPRLISAVGARCPRGDDWIKQEIESPMRTIATSVLVRGGDFVSASVRTNTAIPLERVGAVMESLRGVVLDAPVSIGQTVIVNPAGSGADIVVTRNVARISDG